MRHIVVVGNGIAGLTACDELRAEGFEGRLTVVGEEHHDAYSRPALSKALLALDGDLEAHTLSAPTHGATQLRGISAMGLDRARRRIALSDGGVLHYDGLVIATGSSARRLTDSPAELTLRELADARALREALAGGPSVTVVGGGVLGMEIASGAVAAGCRVTMAATSKPMSKALGDHLSEVVCAAAQRAGLRIRIGDDVGIEPNGSGLIARVDGKRIESDLVITAVGDRPRIDWLEDSGLLTGDALIADDRGRVASDIVAAGDVATWTGAAGTRRLPLWTSAIEQAKVAARALLRGDAAEPLTLQPYFWTEQFGLSVKAVGPLPAVGPPEVLDERVDTGGGLLRWRTGDRAVTVAAANYRIPIPKLRRLAVPEVVTVG